MQRNALFRSVLLALAATAILCGCAHAGKITVRNKSNYTIHMVFKFFDHNVKEWVVCGWYEVKSGATRTLNFNLAPDRKVYWGGKTYDDKRRWPGKKGPHEQHVIFKKMASIKAKTLKTYADAKLFRFKPVDPSQEGNVTINLVN